MPTIKCASINKSDSTAKKTEIAFWPDKKGTGKETEKKFWPDAKHQPSINILDRNKTTLAADQNVDVTLDRVCRGASEKAPEESDGYFFMHRRFIEAAHKGTR